VGEKLLVKSNFADDETNTESQTVLVLHLGGEDSLSRLSGIHGVHLNRMEYIAADASRSTIPWSSGRIRWNRDVFTASALNGAMRRANAEPWTASTATIARRTRFRLRKRPLTGPWRMAPSAPTFLVHKEGLELLNATYASQDEARAKIPAQLVASTRASILKC